MKVVATRLGYYANKRIKEGQEFMLLPVVERDPKTGKVIKDKSGKPIVKVPVEKQFSNKWMMKASDFHKAKAKEKEVVEAEQAELEDDDSADVI